MDHFNIKNKLHLANEYRQAAFSYLQGSLSLFHKNGQGVWETWQTSVNTKYYF